MQFDARLDNAVAIQLGIAISDAIQRNGVDLGVTLGMHFIRLGSFQDLIALGRGGGVVFLNVLAHLITRAILERELDGVARHVRHGDGIGCNGDARAVAAVVIFLFLFFGRGDVGDENVAPACQRAWNNVADVKNPIGKLLFKNARLHFGGQLGRHQLIQDLVSPPGGVRREP